MCQKKYTAIHIWPKRLSTKAAGYPCRTPRSVCVFQTMSWNILRIRVFIFLEVLRILKPGGVYCFRTPNLLHYVTLGSRVLPHSLHLRLANRLRGLDEGAHDPWPTVYRANTRSRLLQLAKETGFFAEELRMVETEPTYGSAHWLLFYPMMAYERAVNGSPLLDGFRANIFGILGKRP